MLTKRTLQSQIGDKRSDKPKIIILLQISANCDLLPYRCQGARCSRLDSTARHLISSISVGHSDPLLFFLHQPVLSAKQ